MPYELQSTLASCTFLEFATTYTNSNKFFIYSSHEIVSLLQNDTLILSPQQMKAIDGISITERHWFVDPSYMHRSGASYSWDAPPNSDK